MVTADGHRPAEPAYVDLHPDGRRIVGAPLVQNAAPRQDKLVFVLDFGDELGRIRAR
jgi:hypothetical protein